MTSLAARIRADVRRAILQILARQVDYALNEEILASSIPLEEGVSVTDSAVREHLTWMENAGLVTTDVVGRFMRAKITDLGLKVASGREIVNGVSRPRPDDL